MTKIMPSYVSVFNLNTKDNKLKLYRAGGVKIGIVSDRAKNTEQSRNKKIGSE
jgi:hypothetical protein